MSLSYWTLRLDSMLKSSRLSYKGCYVGSELDGNELIHWTLGMVLDTACSFFWNFSREL